MEMRFELGLRQTTEQKLHHRLSPEQKIELKQRLALSLETVRDDTPVDPENLLNLVLQEIINQETDEQLKNGFAELYGDEHFREMILTQSDTLLRPKEKSLRDFAILYLHESHGGSFTIEEEGTKRQYNVRAANLIDYIDDPKEAEKEIARMEDLIRSKRIADDSGLIREHGELLDARMVGEAAADSVITLETALRYSLQKMVRGEPLLRSFLEDYHVLKKLDFVLSDRLMNRFASDLIRAREDDRAQRFENALLNRVGEYTLMSMGIIDPKIFTLQHHEIDQVERSRLAKDLQAEGLNLQRLEEKYNLQSSGTLFWNRYAIAGQKPDRVTDDTLRDFITETVRRDSEKILQALDWNTLFSKIQSDIADMKKQGSDKESIKDYLRQSCAELLSEEKFSSVLKELIKGPWHEALKIFYPETKK